MVADNKRIDSNDSTTKPIWLRILRAPINLVHHNSQLAILKRNISAAWVFQFVAGMVIGLIVLYCVIQALFPHALFPLI